MAELFPIHLPLDILKEEGREVRTRYCQVLVNPFKVYGGRTGEELLKTYGVKTRVVKPKPIPSYALNVVKTLRSVVSEQLNTSKEVLFTLNLCKTLPQRITISGKQYDPRELIVVIEQIQKVKLFSRRNNRLLKTAVNLSFEVKGFVTEENLMIVGRKDSVYVLKEKHEEREP
jgi:hypothetical protein